MAQAADIPAAAMGAGGEWATVADWRGRALACARALDSSMMAVERYEDLAIELQAALDPSGAFRKHVSRPSRAGLERFAPEDQAQLESALGHYHVAQSLDSPDSLVFNVFAVFARPRMSRRWLNELFGAAFGPQEYPTDWIARLWHREEVSVPGMAATMEVEAAATAIAVGGWKFVIEARWQDDVPEGVADAVTLHVRGLAGTDKDKSGLLLIVPPPAQYPPSSDPGSRFRRYFTPLDQSYLPTEATLKLPTRVRAVTWESIAERADGHPLGAELRAYLGWRMSLVGRP